MSEEMSLQELQEIVSICLDEILRLKSENEQLNIQVSLKNVLQR